MISLHLLIFYMLDAPSAPVNLTSSVVPMTSVLLSWNPPPSITSCPPVTYSITVTASSSLHPLMISTTDSVTSKVVTGLNHGINYSFTVAGIDAGDRVGENSTPSFLTVES